MQTFSEWHETFQFCSWSGNFRSRFILYTKYPHTDFACLYRKGLYFHIQGFSYTRFLLQLYQILYVRGEEYTPREQPLDLSVALHNLTLTWSLNKWLWDQIAIIVQKTHAILQESWFTGINEGNDWFQYILELNRKKTWPVKHMVYADPLHEST